MRVVTGAEMRDLEKKAFANLGLSSLVVMENAGSRIVEVLKRSSAPLRQNVHILAGPGNNGGDGLVAAKAAPDSLGPGKVYLVGDRNVPPRKTKAT